MSSPESRKIFLKPEPSTLKPSFEFTNGNFLTLTLSSEALERAKKLFDSPNGSQQLYSEEPSPDKAHLDSSPESISKHSNNSKLSQLSEPLKLFESPSETTVQTKEEKEKATEEVDRRGKVAGVKAGMIRQTRGELSYGSSIQPKFVNMVNSTKLTMNSLVKRRSESPMNVQAKIKTEQKLFTKSTKGIQNLLELNHNKNPKGFCSSLGLLIKAENAENFVFKCKCYSNTCSCSDKGLNWEDFYDHMVSSGKKVSKDWVRRHYRLIVWKYASYERKLEPCEGIFSISKVKQDLNKRYDIEVLQSRRSVLKRIQENDEVPYKRMVLCVGVIKNQGTSFNIELTDGWHSMHTEIPPDSLFFPLVQRKVLFQGLKIEVFGCSIQDNKLVLPYNSVRRAAWYRTLGQVGSAIPFPVSISSTKELGGIVGRITVYISRIYPLLFLENNSIKSKFSSNEASYSFFDCIVKDGLVDYSSKKVSSALITFKHNAVDIYENVKLGGLINLYFLMPQANPNHKMNHRRCFVFNHKSKVAFVKKERKDMIKIRKLVDNKTKIHKEVDVIGIVTHVQRTSSNEVFALSLAGVNGNLKVLVHNPSFFGRVLNMVESSTLNYTKYLAFLNVYLENKKNPVIEIKTSNYTEIVHNNFPSHMMHQYMQLRDLNMNTLLSHREECDHFGCVCGLE